jgi:hypothetical protein
MATCYLCGRRILNPGTKNRRTVKTGEWIRRRYVNGKVSILQVHYGKRVVCRWCAMGIDTRAAREERLELLKLAVALLVLFALLTLSIL